MLIVNEFARAPFLQMIDNGMFNYQIWRLWIWKIVFRKVCFRGKFLQIYSYIYASFMNEAQCIQFRSN